MKPPPFEYYNPSTLDAALTHLAEHGYDAKALAGGQSLIPMLNFRLAQPEVLVDLNNISELAYIQPADDGGLRLGAMTRHHQVEHNPLVAERAPLVAEAMPQIATTQIRSRGTFGGSIAHADPSAPGKLMRKISSWACSPPSSNPRNCWWKSHCQPCLLAQAMH